MAHTATSKTPSTGILPTCDVCCDQSKTDCVRVPRYGNACATCRVLLWENHMLTKKEARVGKGEK